MIGLLNKFNITSADPIQAFNKVDQKFVGFSPNRIKGRYWIPYPYIYPQKKRQQQSIDLSLVENREQEVNRIKSFIQYWLRQVWNYIDIEAKH